MPLSITTRRLIMSRIVYRFVLVLALLSVALAWMTMGVTGQSGSKNSTSVYTTKNGEWPAYCGDNAGSRYSPLDQINAEHFNKLEVAWRFKTDNLGTRPEFKLEGTPLMVNGMEIGRASCRERV